MLSGVRKSMPQCGLWALYHLILSGIRILNSDMSLQNLRSSSCTVHQKMGGINVLILPLILGWGALTYKCQDGPPFVFVYHSAWLLWLNFTMWVVVHWFNQRDNLSFSLLSFSLFIFYLTIQLLILTPFTQK